MKEPMFKQEGNKCKRGFEVTKKTRPKLYSFDEFNIVSQPDSCETSCEAIPGCSFYQVDTDSCWYVTSWDYSESVLSVEDTSSNSNPSKCYIRII